CGPPENTAVLDRPGAARPGGLGVLPDRERGRAACGARRRPEDGDGPGTADDVGRAGGSDSRPSPPAAAEHRVVVEPPVAGRARSARVLAPGRLRDVRAGGRAGGGSLLAGLPSLPHSRLVTGAVGVLGLPTGLPLLLGRVGRGPAGGQPVDG